MCYPIIDIYIERDPDTCVYGATCATWGNAVHLVSRLDIWGQIGANMCSDRIYRRPWVPADFFVVAKGGVSADFVLMDQSHRRICEACLFTRGGGHGDDWGRRCKQGWGRYWSSARCGLIIPEANTKTYIISVESGALLFLECRIVSL